MTTTDNLKVTTPTRLDWRTSGGCRVAGLSGIGIAGLIERFGQPFIADSWPEDDLKITCWWNIVEPESGLTIAIRNYKSDPDTTQDWSIAVVEDEQMACYRPSQSLSDKLRAIFGDLLSDY